MPTVRDIITRAFQMARIVPLGVEPKAKETQFGLEALQSLYDEWVSGGMFGRLTDYLADTDYEAEEGQRIRHTSAVTVTLPTSFDDVDGERQPYDLSVIETYDSTTSARAAWLWDRNSWVNLLALGLEDEAPLAHRGMLGLSACLASSLTPFGGEIDPRQERMANAFRSSLSLKAGASQAPRETEYY